MLDEIIYMTSGCGVWKMGSDTLARRAKVSQSTVFNAVRALKQTDLFVVGRLADDNAGKYIFVNKLHPNFEDIMKEVFFFEFSGLKAGDYVNFVLYSNFTDTFELYFYD
ncbi:hypothetical protein ACQKMD_19360 [Viridibacillus sp. NPDC096237]|uniref:hypothetical protein n=1 Tax=Viridibacillus sp. NPDC096237 TaxID=3390721 RepID=UPI003CFCEBE7